MKTLAEPSPVIPAAKENQETPPARRLKFASPTPENTNPKVLDLELDDETSVEDANSNESEDVDDANIPDILDKSAPKPKPGALISKAAARHRLRRVMQPNSRGGFKVSEAVLQDYRSNGPARKSIEKIFEMCGCNPDRC